MKIKTKTKNNIVSSAFFEIKNMSLNIYINTTERWRKYDWKESEDFSVKFGYYKDPEGESIEHDFVQLIAENYLEMEMLNRIEFLCANKEQLWILMPDECVYS